jgi:hypothetical protein
VDVGHAFAHARYYDGSQRVWKSLDPMSIEKDSSQGEFDKYNRTLAYIYLENGTMYNKYMIKQGYAHEYSHNTPYKYQIEFKQAQKTAQANQSGLWNPNTCAGNTTSAPKGQITTTTQTTTKYYTSSASNATRYYPDTCPEWQNLSRTNLRTFNSLEELLASYPSRTLSAAANKPFKYKENQYYSDR